MLPYLKGFDINKDLEFIYYKWYQSTFLGKQRDFFFFFGKFLVWRVCKSDLKFWCKICRIKLQIWILCEKIPKVKRNWPNRSLDEGDITDLKIRCVADFFDENSWTAYLQLIFVIFVGNFEKLIIDLRSS